MTLEKKLARWTAAKEALAKYGSVRKAADGIGIPASTFQGWMGALNDPYRPTAGFSVNAEAVTLGPDGEVKTRRLSLKKDSSTDLLVEGLKAAFKNFRGIGAAPAAMFGREDLLTVYPVADLHFGMLAWAPETGASYDAKIATKVVVDSVARLVDQSSPSKYAVVLGLGDLFHANDHKAVTPKSHHSLDVDGRWPKVFAAGARLMTDIIGMVAQKHPQTEVVFLPGNHDPDAAVCLTVAMSLFYDRHPGITVNDTPAMAWFRRFGNTLLGATHGHTMTKERAAMAMAVDRSEDWGRSKYRHMFMGHIHHETAKEVAGVRVETFQSPAAKDSFNAGAGYRAGRSMSALTFHATEGEIGRHRVNI